MGKLSGFNHAQSTICLIGYDILIISPAMSKLWIMLIMTLITVQLADHKVIWGEATRLARLILPKIKLSKSHTSV